MIGTSEIIFILLVVLLLYGGKRLPEFAKSLGQGIREFKKASQGIDEEGESKSASEPVVLVEKNKKEAE